LTRLAAMALPMIPSPKNATRMSSPQTDCID
jgi:hypothetical protein